MFGNKATRKLLPAKRATAVNDMYMSRPLVEWGSLAASKMLTHQLHFVTIVVASLGRLVVDCFV